MVASWDLSLWSGLARSDCNLLRAKKLTNVFKSSANSLTWNEATPIEVLRQPQLGPRSQAAGLVRGLRLYIYLPVLLPPRRCAAVRRCSGTCQHRSPGLRLKNSG